MCPIQLAEVKVRLLEAKQTLEECISTQDFSRAAQLKDSITELENRRDQILQEMETSSQGADKEVRGEKVHDNGTNVSSASDGWKFTKRFFSSPERPRNSSKMSDDVCGTTEADEHEDQNWSHHQRSHVLSGMTPSSWSSSW